ncbi:MAG: flagellar FliJ family protein [Myxococcota bacterium]|nr:flagellar FliJ family protein [Myxococcota bacterium]
MRKALATLLRVRDVEKKQARQTFGEAERARIAQEGVVGGIHDEIDRARTDAAGRGAGLPAHWIALEHQWRLRKEVELRRAHQELAVREEKAAEARAALTHASRESRVVEAALESYDEKVAVENRRAEGRKLDATATQRWWQENS